MNPHEILIALWADGVMVKLTPDANNLAVPAGRLNNHQRDLLLSNKAELVAYLVSARTTTTALIASAMRRCDQFNDSDQARAEMRQQCQELPPHLQSDLLDHFLGKPVLVNNLQIQKESHHD